MRFKRINYKFNIFTFISSLKWSIKASICGGNILSMNLLITLFIFIGVSLSINFYTRPYKSNN